MNGKTIEASSQLTEFAPLSPEANQPGVGFLFSKFFKFNKSAPEAEFPSPTPSSISPDINVQADWQSNENMDPVNTDAGDLVASFPVDVEQGRSLPNVLKRISSLLALKSTGLQSYKDTDFKQYWMPDSVSKECYDCGEKFTTFRRRHHCRICGQIFCSRCCNQEITGKIMGCTGDLRVCTYCCKVVLSYLQSADMSADLRALQEDLQTKFGHVSTPSSMIQSNAGTAVGNLADSQECVPNTGRRKPSLGFQEDKFALGRAQESHFMSIEERCRALQKSASLRALYEDICRPNTGLTLLNHRYRLRNYPGCFLGSELNDWLVAQGHAATRIQATAIGQALLEAGYIENISEQNFIDGYALYKPKQVLTSEQFVGPGTPDEERRRSSHDPQEPYWVKQITQQESTTTTDSESECHISEHDEILSLPSSGSTFYLDLNIEENTVHLSRPLNAKQEQQNTDNELGADPKHTLIIQNQAQDTSRQLGLSKEFLSGALLLPSCQIRDVVPESGWHKVKQLRSDNGELDAFTRLSAAFKQHEQNMLKQLLNAEGLSQSWMDVMIPLVENIVDVVRPDAHNDADDMDIRQYVQFKKVPGGSRNESCIVNGIVCTKNVAHRAMATELKNPRILLLGCSIVYQRIEGRLLSLEPVMMQEHEYLRHVVARIANLQPDLVLVHRNVSRLAQEFLLALKVTLVLNVKASVLERIARCTQAHIISTVDAHIGRPQLGTCQSFYLKTFHNEKGPSKTLMFFEGCSSQHLGCTVILRGAAISELAKLKRVANRLVFIHYSWRLEKSYLMDEFARPPSPPADTFFEENTSNGSPQDESRFNSEQCLEINIPGESCKANEIQKESTINNEPTFNVKPGEIKTHSISEKHSNGLESTEIAKTLDAKEIKDEFDRTVNSKEVGEKLCKCSFDNGSSIDRKSSPHIYCVQRHSTGNVEDNIDKSENNRVHKSELNEWKSMNEIIRIESKEKSVSEEKRMNVESVSDFSDPLRNFVYLSQDDEVFVPSSQSNGSAQCLSVAELPLTNRFRKALDDTILSSSPFLKFTVPYLETEAGRNCALRKYFPDEIFWSAQFEQLGAPNPAGSTRTASSVDGVDSVLQDGDSRLKGLKMQLRPQHPFVSAKLTSPADSNEVQTLLAHFRACGGRLVPSATLNESSKPNRPPTRGNSTTVESTSSATSGVVKQGTWCDALDPANHQKLSVLFCSYSHESQNAPAFCVNPWVVHMDFYGHNDIPLGSFLERYCFRSSYVCPSESCSTPMLKHVRRFVHDMGCVQIMLKDLDEPISEAEENHILMWNRCSKCKMVSPAVPMSADTWALSFAKYLELRFHGGMYRRRGQEGNICAHSLHYDHCQFFAMKNIVAYFEYTSISQWEISLPPPLIATYYDPQQQANVIEEIKMLALKGYEVYTSIQEKLCTFEAEMEVIVGLKQQLQKEQAYFKSCIEEIQLKLTSPTLEAKKLEGQIAERDVQMLMWRIEDSVVNLKRLISEIVTSWNARIQDLLLLSKRRDEKHKKGEGGKPSAPTTSFSLEYDRMSSGSLHVSDDVVEVIPSSITTAQWEDTSSCSEGREDTSPSSPEPNLMVPGAKAALDCQGMTEGEDNLSLEANHDTVPPMDTEAQNLNTIIDATLPSHTDYLKNAEDIMETVNRPVISGSPRGHVRSYSDVTPSLGEEGSDTKHVQTSDKKSVKTILSQLLPSSSAMAPIQSPLSCQEHHLSAAGCSVPVVVYENEPSSIIAYALSSPEYRRSLDEICAKKYASSDQATPSPVHKRKTGVIQAEKEVSGSSDSMQSSEAKRSGVLSFLRGSSSANSTGRTKILDGVQYSTGSAPSNGNDTSASEVDEPSVASNKTDSKSNRASASNIEVQFSDGTCNFYCRVYFGEQFANLRETVLPSGEEGFIRSLSRCVQWAARGGKSGSNFCKTKDDRFVLKEMSKIEMQIFLDFAPNYFGYVQRCLSSNQPTLLGKIVGVYRIVYRNLTSNATLRSNLLVMENLFYSRYVTHKFDLKGSERNRLVNPVTADRDGEIVLLDENLLRRTCDDPLYILPHSKTVLTQAINNDTQFLASQSVMDYSLLVGLDKKRRELVVGIIDYIRTFTWDKKLETMVKSTGFLGGQGKQPTIVSPELYRARFIAAMHRYFLPVPDRWTGLGKGLDC